MSTLTNSPLYAFGTGQPLIVLNGWGWKTSIWDFLLPILAKEYQVIVVNLIEFSRREEMISFLASHLPSQAIWLGWSLGGMLALDMAIQFPTHVSKLITVAASPKFLNAPDWPGTLANHFDQFVVEFTHDPETALATFLTWQLRGSLPSLQLKHDIKKKLIIPTQQVVPNLISQLHLLATLDLRSELHKIHCPTLHFFGKNDILIPANTTPLIRNYLPLSRCEILNYSGHFPFLSQQNEFVTILKQFLF